MNLNLFRSAAKSGSNQGVVTATSYGAPDEHPMSTRSASDGDRWNIRVWKYAAMLLFMLMIGIGNAWAGGNSTTYYAKVTAKVSNTGGGKVYASTSNTTPAASDYSSTKTAQGSKTDAGVTLYIFATPNDGYAFKGWSKTDNKYDLGTNSPYTVSSGTNGISTSNSTYTEVGPYYATFVKIFQFKAKASRRRRIL